MAQQISVLLIEDDPDYVALVRAWLAANREIEFSLHWTETLSEGIEHLAGVAIDIVLLDLSLPDSDGPQTFRILRTRARQVPIILLSGNDRESLALELVGAGAQDYLVKGHCSAEVLSRAILYALLRRPEGKEGVEAKPSRVVNVLSAKGGVGVTTLACVLAAELRRLQNGKVLLVDLDVHANAVSFLFGIKPTYTLLDALSNAHRLDESALESVVSEAPHGLHVLASPALRGGIEPTADQLQQLLYRLNVHYRWIVLDLGRLDSRVMSLLESADQTIVVSSTSLASLYETRRAVSTLKAAGCEGDKLLLSVSELPGVERLSDASVEEMVGLRPILRLPDSSAELKLRGATNGLPRANSDYGQNVARLAMTLAGASEKEQASKRPSRAFSWR
jgi:Flp pilus assembly CpaE family ATPase